LHRISVIALFCAGLSSVQSTDAQWRLEQPLDSLVASGIDLILKQEYRKADSLFRDVAAEYPQHPAGYLFQAAVRQAYAIDFTVQVGRKEFDSLLVLGREKAANLQWPWREYFLATADGYEAYERVERGDWFGGVRMGRSSAGEFENIVEKDSSFYDAYVGIGTYYYWRSRKTEFLHWLPFVRDDRALGISLVELAADRSAYNRFAAVSALVSILLDAERYAEVLQWSERGLASYPENRIYLWGKATALDRQKRAPEAVEAYQNLLANIVRSSAPHPYDEIVCRLNLAQCQLVLKDTSEAKRNLQAVVGKENAAFPVQLRDRAVDKFDRANELLVRLRNGAGK
jgi:tetratricopeptide (TPR) repeat protein